MGRNNEIIKTSFIIFKEKTLTKFLKAFKNVLDLTGMKLIFCIASSVVPCFRFRPKQC